MLSELLLLTKEAKRNFSPLKLCIWCEVWWSGLCP